MPSSVPPRGDRLVLVLALLVAFLLHLPAHLGWDGGPAARESLYEDGPAVVANPAFEAYGTERLGAILARVASDPAASWGVGEGVAARASWRPVATSALAVQRWVFGARTAPGAGAVSLLLHLAVVALALRLLSEMDAPRAARWVGAFVVAASPVALSAAAWPARQPILLATALGTAGLVLLRRDGRAAAFLGALLLAAAGLSHEMAFGFALAALVLRRWPAGPAPRRGAAMVCAVVGAAAAVWWMRFRGPESSGLSATDALGNAVALVHAAGSLLVPARLHFADGPWTVGAPWSFALLAVAIGGTLLLGRRTAAGALAAAALCALWPRVLLGVSSLPSGAPYHDGVLYMVLPLGAGAVGWALASAVARGGALRVAAALAGAVWVGANVCATATRAGDFRTRAAHAGLAALEMPESPVVEAWQLDQAVTAAKPDEPGAVERLQDLAPRAASLARRAGGDASAVLRRDPIAAVTVASALCRYAQALVASGVAPDHGAAETAEAGAALATELAPDWSRTWVVLATTRERTGSLRAAMVAATRAVDLAPEDVDVRSVGVSIALALGDRLGAVAGAEELLALERAQAQEKGRRPRADVLLLYARASTADGASQIRDPAGRLRYRFEPALNALREVLARGERVEDARREIYATCLAFGDFLTSEDRTGLALLAYREATETNVRDVEAAEHERWLRARLAEEERAAEQRLARAQRGEGNVADALVALATAYARQARWKDAEEVFDRIEASLGPSPALRYHRVMQVLRHSDLERAIEEMRRVVADSPDLARAHYDLALLQDESGELAAAAASLERARSLAESQAAAQGAEEWLLDADLRLERIRQELRDAARPGPAPR